MSDEPGFVFGDAEPEDAWDVDDPVDEQAENLRRRLVLLDERVDPDGLELAELVVELGRRVDRVRARRGELDDRATLRLELLELDLEYVRGRL